MKEKKGAAERKGNNRREKERIGREQTGRRNENKDSGDE